MLLAVDIGNSAIKFGVFDGESITSKFSIPTTKDLTARRLAQEIGDRLVAQVDNANVCSVVPEINDAIRQFVSDQFRINARFVNSTDHLGLIINFPVVTTGADRLVNSIAAAEKYGTPCIVISFGTATTIDVVNTNREYLGGLIAPGMKVNAQALAIAASRLPEVELSKPALVIAQTTETAIQSGIVYGHIEMIKGLLLRVADEIREKPRIVATGGFARMLANEIDEISIVDEDLTLSGLMLLHRRGLNPDR